MMTAMHPRRLRSTVLAGALAAVLILTGCSSDSADTSDTTVTESPAAEGALPVAEGTVEYPLTLSTAWGETVLEERPERIAAISPQARDVELLALLGVTPVVAPQTVERAVWTLDALPGEIEEIYEADVSGITPHELVAASDPDLIIGFGKSLADEYAQLSTIAPVVAAQTEEEASDADWRAELRAIAEALDLTQAAEDAIVAYDEWFDDAAADNPEFAGLTVTYAVQYSAEYGLHYQSTPGSDVERLLLDLGFAPNPLAENFVTEAVVSDELVSGIDADVLLLADQTGDESELEQLLTGTSLFQQLGAVQSGQYVVIGITDTGYLLDGEEHEGNLPWALARSGPLGQQWAAEQLIPILHNALN